LIYERALSLQIGAFDESAAISLMSTDMEAISRSMEMIHEIWARSIEIVIGIALLARQLGWVCVMPLTVVGICSFGSTKIAAHIGGRMQIWQAAVQSRISMVSSMLALMNAVKLMGLSSIMAKSIQDQRIRELNFQKGYRWCIVYLNILGKF